MQFHPSPHPSPGSSSPQLINIMFFIQIFYQLATMSVAGSLEYNDPWSLFQPKSFYTLFSGKIKKSCRNYKRKMLLFSHSDMILENRVKYWSGIRDVKTTTTTTKQTQDCYLNSFTTAWPAWIENKTTYKTSDAARLPGCLCSIPSPSSTWLNYLSPMLNFQMPEDVHQLRMEWRRKAKKNR